MLVEKTGIHRRKGHFWEQKREVPCVGRVLPPASQAMAYTMVLEAFSRLNLELLAPVEIRNVTQDVSQDMHQFQTEPVR